MKTALLALKFCRRLLVGFALILAGCDSPIVRSTHGDLVWEEEFNGTAVDASRWTFESGGGGWGNSELQVYQSSNADLRDIPGGGRALVITSKSTGGDAPSYTSSRLKTQGKASWRYGTIEARLKLPQGQGLWPAFWMLGESMSNGRSWPATGEIDIMEMVGGGTNDRITHGTAHWSDGGHVYQGGQKILPAKLSQDFHVYAVHWTAQALQWSVDGEVYYTLPITDAMSELREPQFLLLNLAVGGQWPGSPDGTTVFPQEYWIDWIRVHQ